MIYQIENSMKVKILLNMMYKKQQKRKGKEKCLVT